MKTRAISMRFTETQLEVLDALVVVRRQEYPWRTWGRADVVAQMLDEVPMPTATSAAHDRLRTAITKHRGDP